MESVAQTYAKALFSLSIEKKTSEELLNEVKDISSLVESNGDLIKILDSKSIDKEKKKEIVDTIFSGKIDNDLQNFLKLLIDKSRINYLEQICLEYKKIYLDYHKIKEAKVYSVTKLSQEKLNEIKEGLELKYNSKFTVENFIDEKLVAGVKVIINDLVLDGSVSNKLDRMKSSIVL